MIITFDLPLWIKATRIVLETGMRIVVRLVGFHILKNFSGCIGCIMAGAHKNYISDDRCYYKALRAHFLIDAAIYCFIKE